MFSNRTPDTLEEAINLGKQEGRDAWLSLMRFCGQIEGFLTAPFKL